MMTTQEMLDLADRACKALAILGEVRRATEPRLLRRDTERTERERQLYDACVVAEDTLRPVLLQISYAEIGTGGAEWDDTQEEAAPPVSAAKWTRRGPHYDRGNYTILRREGLKPSAATRWQLLHNGRLCQSFWRLRDARAAAAKAEAEAAAKAEAWVRGETPLGSVIS